ncbi:diguanylate cyclase/phosphodiesterase (GGDEF & EAL domains) with PAS/PAC sensor(s) [hydrothermal vent metagenome]|uniref:Diguanylate cyclase/phosphodiesterase (GGDEF & EAL domains) with PAS/PAC sensor(S) n=1 Tax=hydrothermal vent metagenome TaxID=652676 RepID=A0A3B1BEZ6_9ZZZZ
MDMQQDNEEAKIIKEFFDDYAEQFTLMEREISNGHEQSSKERTKNWISTFHKLRGAAGLFGLDTVSAKAGVAEDMLNLNELPPTEMVSKISDYISEIKTLIKIAQEDTSAQQDTDADEAISTVQPASTVLPETGLTEPKLKTLIVTNDTKLKTTIEGALPFTRFTVSNAGSLHDVMSDIMRNGLDTLFYDLDIQGEDGFQVIDSVISFQSCKKTKIVLLANTLTIELRKSAAQREVIGLLAKPVEPNSFSQWVDIMLNPLENEPRFLVVDDDSHFLAGLTLALGREKMQVFSIQDPQKSLEAITNIRPHLIMLDIDMPGLNGLELLAMIKQAPQFCFIPVIIATGSETSKHRLAAWKLGADDFVLKSQAVEMIPRIRARLRDAVQKQNLTRIDALTGLSNRRRFEEEYEARASTAQAQRWQVSIAIIDLDNFKLINDTYGHSTGDMVLREFGALLKSRFRSSDLVCRYGGEEFAMVLMAVGVQKAVELLKSVQETLQNKKFVAGAKEFGISFSAGVASISSGKTAKSALVNADKALYKAKNSGKGKIISNLGANNE